MELIIFVLKSTTDRLIKLMHSWPKAKS